MKFFNAILALCFATAAFSEKCCENDCPLGQAKFYSIEVSVDKCGECCMDPDEFPFVKKYEEGLEIAEVMHPCAALGYTEYELSPVHSVKKFNYTIVIDRYKKPEILFDEEVEEIEEQN